MARQSQNCFDKRPHFFKVLLGDFSECLRIPPAFMKHISMEASSSTAILKCIKDSVWTVELRKKINGTYLQDGWKEFSQAHSLRGREFLLFRYDGNLRFSVQIFDETACQIEDICDSKTCEEPTFQKPKKRGRPPKKSLDFDQAIHHQKEYNIDSRNHPSSNLSAAQHSYLFRGKSIPSPEPKEIVQIDTEVPDSHINDIGSHSRGVQYLPRRGQSVTSKEKAKFQETANSFTSDLPFFKRCINWFQANRGSSVQVPVCFKRAHLHREEGYILLRDPQGKAYKVRLCTNKSVCNISRGWAAFAHANNIERGDTCIFELVGKREMRVHIFRSVEENMAGSLETSDGSWRIPPAFMKHISMEASSRTTAVLKGHRGSIWHVELRKKINGTYIQDGWKEFSQAHALRESEFLLFRYDGDLHFSVQIYDKTACEREDICNSKTCQESTFQEQKKRAVYSQKASKFESENHLSSNLSASQHSFRGKHMPSPNPEEVVHIETEDPDLRESEIGLHAEGVQYFPRKQSVTSEEKENFQETASSFTSNFPFFTRRINGSQARQGSSVLIPGCFARAHLPKERANIVLRDLHGKAWEVTLFINKKMGCHISGGWSAFARDNSIEEGDSCIFELVDKLEMRVHIFRSLKETKPITPPIKSNI
ncbi:putative B3 domain-containing protein Os03g0621600 [Tasmannia lanceolata]|uniref:putative B3 domain-containing protein Os03g0621600 n=1 Tax=Tasmannia lanceolata TaxID=3420 RepID=UPI0040644AA3